MTEPAITQPDRRGKTVIAIDLETFLIADGVQAPPLVCMSYATRGAGGELISGLLSTGDPELEPTLEELLTTPEILLTGTNLPFDLSVLMAHEEAWISPIFKALDADRIETIDNRQRLIDNAAGNLGWGNVPGKKDGKVRYQQHRYAQAQIEYMHLGINRMEQKVGRDDIWRLRYAELWGIPAAQWPQDAITYAVEDAELALRVYEAQEPAIELLDDSFRLMRRHMGLRMLECAGLRSCARTHFYYEQYTQARLDRDREVLLEAGLVEYAKKPTKAQKEKNVPPPWYAKKVGLARERMNEIFPDCPRGELTEKMKAKGQTKGNPKLDEEACILSGDPLLQAFQRFSSASTILTNIEDLRKGIEGVIQPRINPMVETGRPSCSNPNLFNRRKEFGDRECITAREGFVFAQGDYSGLELHTLAQSCIWLIGRSKLGEALRAGMDAHSILAGRLGGVSYEEARTRYKQGDPIFAGDHGYRAMAKMGNFALGGGMGERGLVRNSQNKFSINLCGWEFGKIGHRPDCKECLEKAAFIRRGWRETWDEMDDYFRCIKRMLDPVDGKAWIRQAYSNRHRGDIGYTQTSNTWFQGLGADATGHALWLLTKACYDPAEQSLLYGDRPVLYVYDEFILETPDTYEAHDHAMEMARIAKAGADVWLPDVPVNFEPLLMRRWAKNARELYDDNGRLKAWDVDIIEGFTKEAERRKLTWRPDPAAFDVSAMTPPEVSRKAHDERILNYFMDLYHAGYHQ